MQARSKIAVAGATGRVGRHVVDVLKAQGHDVVAMSRSSGVDVVSGDGLAQALAGVECIIDVATGPSPDQAAATEFFTAAARNLQEAGLRAGVQRIVVVSIIGADRFTAGYNVAKLAHERAMLAGPIPVRILRAAQFHEFVAQLVDWGRQGEVSYLPIDHRSLLGVRSSGASAHSGAALLRWRRRGSGERCDQALGAIRQRAITRYSKEAVLCDAGRRRLSSPITQAGWA